MALPARRGYRVEYEDMALAFTEAPTNCEWPDAPSVSAGRFGILQAVYKHRGVLHAKGRWDGWRCPTSSSFPDSFLPLVSPAHRHHVLPWGTIWYYIQKTFPSGLEPIPPAFHKLVLFLLRFPW